MTVEKIGDARARTCDERSECKERSECEEQSECEERSEFEERGDEKRGKQCVTFCNSLR